MTKIPSVEERAAAFKKQFCFLTIERLMDEGELALYKDDMEMENEDDIYIEAESSDIHDYFRKALTADRTAVILQVRKVLSSKGVLSMSIEKALAKINPTH